MRPLITAHALKTPVGQWSRRQHCAGGDVACEYVMDYSPAALQASAMRQRAFQEYPAHTAPSCSPGWAVGAMLTICQCAAVAAAACCWNMAPTSGPVRCRSGRPSAPASAWRVGRGGGGTWLVTNGTQAGHTGVRDGPCERKCMLAGGTCTRHRACAKCSSPNFHPPACACAPPGCAATAPSWPPASRGSRCA